MPILLLFAMYAEGEFNEGTRIAAPGNAFADNGDETFLATPFDTRTRQTFHVGVSSHENTLFSFDICDILPKHAHITVPVA